jgi:hypothetical protein
MPIKNVFASIAVKDLDSAVRWYEKLFIRPPSRAMLEVAEWSFERGGCRSISFLNVLVPAPLHSL